MCFVDPVAEDDEIDVVNPYGTVKQRRSPSNVPPNQRTQQLTIAACNVESPARRPRGRPPTNPSRKRRAQSHQSAQQPAAKRSCQRRRKSRASRRHSSDEEAEEQDRRSLHNDMERQRRVDLRNHFEELRQLVPATASREKAPKVTILIEARKHCAELTDQSRQMKERLAQKKQCHIKMQAKLQNLLALIPESQRSRILKSRTPQEPQMSQEPQASQTR